VTLLIVLVGCRPKDAPFLTGSGARADSIVGKSVTQVASWGMRLRFGHIVTVDGSARKDILGRVVVVAGRVLVPVWTPEGAAIDLAADMSRSSIVQNAD